MANYKIQSQRGYVLLVLLLFLAVLSIASLKIVQDYRFQYQRDREEELIHRGVQYSRAIKNYYKKFGRYPTKIEDLENTNNLRFLRKRFKDPINRDPQTGKERDFKLLHFTDVQMSFGNAPNGTTSVADLAAQQAIQQRANGIAGVAGAATASAGAVTQEPQNGDQSDTSQADQSASGAPPPQPLSPQVGPTGAPQVFGGGAIVGVASLSKAKTIREFNKQDHYNQWQFVYDPTLDRGGLLMTPKQPPLLGASQNPQGQNQPQQNSNQGPFGQPVMTPNPQTPQQQQ